MADRDRIACELHDSAVQRLFVAGLSLQSVADSVDDDVAKRIDFAIEQIDETIAELRAAIRELAEGARP